MQEEYSFELSDLNKELEGNFEIGEELEGEDFEELKVSPPKRPSFPIFIFICAVAKDILDIISLGLLGTFTNIIVWIIIRLWLFRKVNFIQRMLYRRYVFAWIIEFIPFFNWIPQWSIFVLRAHATEYKKIDQILTAIEGLIIRFQKGKL